MQIWRENKYAIKRTANVLAASVFGCVLVSPFIFFHSSFFRFFFVGSNLARNTNLARRGFLHFFRTELLGERNVKKNVWYSIGEFREIQKPERCEKIPIYISCTCAVCVGVLCLPLSVLVVVAWMGLELNCTARRPDWVTGRFGWFW